MKDSQQMSVEVSAQNNMALQALPPVTVKDSNLFPMDNVTDDEVVDESFHLHLSEDEEDEKTEKKQEETKASTVSSDAPAETAPEETAPAETTPAETAPAETEDDILDKFVTTESPALENVDDKLEDKLLDDAEDVEANVPTDKPAGDAEKQEDEGKTTSPNSECDKDSKDSSADDKKTSVGSAVENEVDSDETTCGDSDVTNKEKSSGDSDKCEAASDDSENSANSDDNAKEEKANAEILKDQIMDTEDLLQIVDKKDTEENNDKDSSGGSSPHSADKGESEDTEMECNDTETEKMDQEDDESETDKGAAKEDDGVDIEEDTSFKGEFDSELDKEYEKMAKDRDSDEDKSGEDEETSDEQKSNDATDTAAAATGDNIAEKSKDTSLDETSAAEDVAMETAPSDEDSGKKNDAKDDVDSMTNDAATSDAMEESLSADKEATAVAEKAESTTEKIDDASDAVVTDSSTKSSKRSLSDTSTESDAKKIKLQESDGAAVPKSMAVEVNDKKSEEATPDYDVVTPASKIVVLNAVSEYMQSKKLTKLSRNDLEQICLMKMCEAICHKSEIGELRHQLGVQEQMVEMWRKEAAQLTKQARDLEIVNKRLLHEVRLKNERDKPLIPVKITRSVGLQVRSDSNMMTSVMTPKRRINRSQPTNTVTPAKQNRYIHNRTNINTPTKVVTTPGKNVVTPGKNIVTPGKSVAAVANKVTTPTQAKVKVMPAKSPSSLLSQALQNSAAQAAAATPTTTAAASTPSHVSTATPSTPTASSTVTLVSTSTTPTTPVPTSAPIASKSITNSSTKSTPKPAVNSTPKPAVNSTPKPAVNSKAFIDLTDEDDKKPATAGTPTPTTLTTSAAQGVRIVSAPVKAGNVVTTAGVVNPPRIMYVYNNQLHHGVLAADATKPGAQKLMLKLNSNVIGQAANGVLTTVANGSTITVGNAALRAGQVQPVRLSSPVTAARNATTAKTVLKHPAPLPLPPASQLSMPARKPIPPKPHLSIRRSSGGIVLSWKMPYNLDNYEAIASYQLYAYQETTSPPSSDMWRKVGDVKALALPMACTLTQFADGNKYHFAVRAVDVQKRMGPFSDPEQILL